MRNTTGLVFCALAPLTGFLMICLGAYFISSDSIFSCWENMVLTYLLLPLGFVILLSGIFWSTYRQVRESKGMFIQDLERHFHQGAALPLATVDRPNFYPPAYEGGAEKKPGWAEGAATGVPPPLYSETDLEHLESTNLAPEAPPSYEESVVDQMAATRPGLQC
ncbi:transmembrane protein 252 [Sorex fumeus]|uniref:transmembrane protein 252 n=1 Tax=Sorex fumeus TaxID=62283 RepID=UPI0024AD418E|nr:transmembrane protein 252 [Sorex fumeus]